jgi:hypothetical protein
MRSSRAVGFYLAGFLAVAGLPSCQWAGDTSAAKVSYAALKNQLADVNSRLMSAVQNAEYDRVVSLDKEMNFVLDSAMKQNSAMNILDREHLSINVATARRCITDMDRYAQGGDADLVKAQAQQLAPTVSEIQDLLDRAERTTTAK